MREGWVSDIFSNCIKLKSGDGLTAKKMIPGKIPVYGGNGIAGYHSQSNLNGSQIIIGRVGALCGKVRHLNEEIWLTDNAFKISEYKYDFDPKFLTYLLNHLDLRSFARQAAQPVISNSSLKDVLLTFPKSLPEQKAIVKILDEAFAKIDQAKANIEKNIENAKELFQSKLNEIFSQRLEGDAQSLPKGWEEKMFKEVCVLQRGFDLPKRLRTKGEYSLITSSGATDTHNEFKVKGPGVATGRSGSIGKVFYVETDFWPLNTALYIKNFFSNKEKYIFYFLKAFDLSRFASGSGVPTLNRNHVHDETVLSTSDINVQEKIISQLDQLSIQLDEMTISLQKKLNLIEELKKSILQKAFSGELTKMSEPMIHND